VIPPGRARWSGPRSACLVFPIIEPEIKAHIDERVYQGEVGIAEVALKDSEQIVAAVRAIRQTRAEQSDGTAV
jgi:hypothetical protein